MLDTIAIIGGHPAGTTGWYVDLHGHAALLSAGDVAPTCPHDREAGTTLWRLESVVRDGPGGSPRAA